MAIKCLISYRCGKRHVDRPVYGMSVDNNVVSFLESIKKFEDEEYVILGVYPLNEEEATAILNMELNSF